MAIQMRNKTTILCLILQATSCLAQKYEQPAWRPIPAGPSQQRMQQQQQNAWPSSNVNGRPLERPMVVATAEDPLHSSSAVAMAAPSTHLSGSAPRYGDSGDNESDADDFDDERIEPSPGGEAEPARDEQEAAEAAEAEANNRLALNAQQQQQQQIIMAQAQSEARAVREQQEALLKQQQLQQQMLVRRNQNDARLNDWRQYLANDSQIGKLKKNSNLKSGSLTRPSSSKPINDERGPMVPRALFNEQYHNRRHQATTNQPMAGRYLSPGPRSQHDGKRIAMALSEIHKGTSINGPSLESSDQDDGQQSLEARQPANWNIGNRIYPSVSRAGSSVGQISNLDTIGLKQLPTRRQAGFNFEAASQAQKQTIAALDPIEHQTFLIEALKLGQEPALAPQLALAGSDHLSELQLHQDEQQQQHHNYGAHYGSLNGHQLNGGKSNYYQFAESHKRGQFESGFKRGNKKFQISGHSSQNGVGHAEGHVKWHGKGGKGMQYWDFKHKDKKDYGKQHHYGAEHFGEPSSYAGYH